MPDPVAGPPRLMFMDPNKVQEIQILLEGERTRLSTQLEELASEEGQEFDSNFADSSQVTAERGELEALANSLRKDLDEVVVALERIDEGTYGTCRDCGTEIPDARLEAMPEAVVCITCASA